MGLFTEKYNTPFDNEADRKNKNIVPTALHVSALGYLSTRSSLFLGYTLISLSLLCNNEGIYLWWPFAAALAVLSLWSVTLRIFMPRKLAPLSLLIIELMFFGLCVLSSRFGFCSDTAPVYFVPMSLGIMMLGRFKDDGEDDYKRAKPWSEVYRPFLIASVASLFGFLASSLFEKRYVFVALLSAAMFLVVYAYLRTKLTGKREYLTSKSLTEMWNIPVADIEELRRFVFTRFQLGITAAGAVSALLAVSAFAGKYAVYLMFPSVACVSAGLGVLMIITGRSGDRKSIFGSRFFLTEAAMAAAWFVIPFVSALPQMPELTTIIKWAALIIFADILITGLLAVIRRRLIFVPKIRYVEGLPFYMVLVSLVLMIIEVIG